MTTVDKFWDRVTVGGNCWMWKAGLTTNGYGCFWAGGKHYQAHRWAYEHYIGPIPRGLEMDHLCRTRACVNPKHVEPVTHLENMRRAKPYHYNTAKTHCKKGHEFTPENTRIRARQGGGRVCRTCHREENGRA